MKIQSEAKKLSDYQSLNYFIKHTELSIDLSFEPVTTNAKLSVEPNPDNKPSHNTSLTLDGQNIDLLSVMVDGQLLEPIDYSLTEESLTIKSVPADKPFIIEMNCGLRENTDLFGLYVTEGTAIVKAETEGLRRLFYLHDRPDNLSTYKTTIIADKEEFPVLLSNGVIKQRKELPMGRHSVTWYDPLPKPSYLFALVAGKLKLLISEFKTKTDRPIPIEFFVPEHALQQCEFAIRVLQHAMRWDETALDLPCDLEHMMVAGVDKYPSGASEPTGLLLFNTANLFASQASKTDLDILRVLEVVAHEYFHYWSGDRVTIRDWFNLPLKEGLTTFRAAMFREDLFGTDLIRMLDGKNLDERAPRQSSYTAVRSLYTAAAYEKSADIFRMMMLVVGRDSFFNGLTQFFKENDGQAITLETFLDFVSYSTGVDLQKFLPWFTESEIPNVVIEAHYNEKKNRYYLKVTVENRKNRPIPMIIGLINSDGEEVLSDRLHLLEDDHTTLVFDDIESHPTPSLFRSFSAPVYIKYNYTIDDLILLMLNDSNLYNRCEASKALLTGFVIDYCSGKEINPSSRVIDAYKVILKDPNLNGWMKAQLLALPPLEDLVLAQHKPCIEKTAEGLQLLRRHLAVRLTSDLLDCSNRIQFEFDQSDSKELLFDIKNAGLRRLFNTCYSYLACSVTEKTKRVLANLFWDSLNKNMTDTISALSLLCEIDAAEADQLLERFFDNWKDNPGAVNYWFKLQATMHSEEVVGRVEKLLFHPAFDSSNPNKVFALLSTFINNPYGFHASSGMGYKLIEERIIELDKTNPTIAMQLLAGYTNCKHYDDNRFQMMLSSLMNISNKATSDDVRHTAKTFFDSNRVQPPLSIKRMFPGDSVDNTNN